ncbi:MAG TPA: hypothetical protein VFN56_01445 [Candidatus Saccharimonadales bacterium]|nr:hypothetical protein [Candidatus Saccharimonadales bacterium]
MQWGRNLLNSNQIYNEPRTPGGYEKTRQIKLLLLVIGVVLAIVVVMAVVPYSQQSKDIKSATTAARKQIPNAQVTNIKVAGGFALAVVRDPSATGQANAGNRTVFRVNKDGSMTQLASGSSFGPLDLLELGIPLETQAELTGSSSSQVKQNLAYQCGYNNGAIGFDGFDGSFSPGDWQIDSATLTSLEQKLTSAISNLNGSQKSGAAVICVNATRNNSNTTTDRTTYISTFTLQVQFITTDGTLTTHTVTFAIGPNYYRKYTLDGQTI